MKERNADVLLVIVRVVEDNYCLVCLFCLLAEIQNCNVIVYCHLLS